MNLIKLKIKAKHLALEPAIIKKEERKLPGADRSELQGHRIHDVRNEARATQLAIAFLKGKELKKLESVRKDKGHWKHSVVLRRLKAMVHKYCPRGTRVPDQDITDWFNNIS